MQITDTPENAFDKVAMDIVGPLPRTRTGNLYILTAQDLLTKLVIAAPLKKTTSMEIAKAFTKKVICVYGSPKSILTDQGSNLISKLMKNFAKIFRIKRYRTTAFRPQSNGSLERSHHSLVEYLKQFTDQEEEWDEWLELATFSYNTSVHEGTKYQPFQLIYGRPARLPSARPYEDQTITYEDFITELITKIHEVQSLARENLISAKERSKRYYDRTTNEVNFLPGDYVFLLKGKKKGKLHLPYEGPYEVIDIMPNGNVRIKLGRKDKIVHPNRLAYSEIRGSAEQDSESESE